MKEKLQQSINQKEISLVHYDFDGIASAIVLLQVFPNIKIVPCTYATVNSNFEKNLNNSNYDSIFIADLSLNEDPKIQNIVNAFNDKIHWVDHHPLKYDFKFKNQLHDMNHSGSYLTLKYVMKHYGYKPTKEILNMVKFSEDYDLWFHKYSLSKSINRLFYYYGFYPFLYRFRDGFDGLKPEEIEYLRKNNEYVKKTLKETQFIKVTDNVVFVTVDQLIDEFAEHYQKTIEGVNSVFVYNPNSKGLSIRGSNKNIHYGKFAEMFGGGGHQYASGIKTNGDFKEIEKIIDEFLKL